VLERNHYGMHPVSRRELVHDVLLELNHNSKISAMIDYSGSEPVKVFETSAILLYLAERFDRFIRNRVEARVQAPAGGTDKASVIWTSNVMCSNFSSAIRDLQLVSDWAE